MIRRAFALSIVTLALVGLPEPSRAQTVDEIIAKNIEAKGGLEKIKAVTSIRQTSTINVQGMAASLTIYSKRPNLMRQEITLGPETIINGFDGQTPWIVNSMSGSKDAMTVSGPQADMIRRQSAFDGPVIDYKARDIKAELVGSETLGDKPVHHIKMTMPDGTMQHLYLDAGTGLEAKVTMEAPGGVTTEQLLTDYRPVDGLMLPHSITVMTGGVVSAQMTITKVEFNPTLDDAMFRIPR